MYTFIAYFRRYFSLNCNLPQCSHATGEKITMMKFFENLEKTNKKSPINKKYSRNINNMEELWMNLYFSDDFFIYSPILLLIIFFIE